MTTDPRRGRLAGLAVILMLTVPLGCGRGETQKRAETFVLASTTSTQDSGFLDALAPEFESQHPTLRMKVVAVGSGEALELGRTGDADVLLVHSPEDELRFMQEGNGLNRKPVMSNDFVIAGPPQDPARIGGLEDAVAAFRAIATSRARFVSRGDESGTHKKELKLWRAAQIDPEGDWYLSSGQGMAETLVVAAEASAYVLTDTATFKATAPSGLTILLDSDDDLVNPYSVIEVSKARHAAAAKAFSVWITGAEGRAFIQSFGSQRHGGPLFEVANR